MLFLNLPDLLSLKNRSFEELWLECLRTHIPGNRFQGSALYGQTDHEAGRPKVFLLFSEPCLYLDLFLPPSLLPFA